MSNRQNKSKPMSISDLSKRMTTRSQVHEQTSTSVQNPPKVTNTDPTNNTVDHSMVHKVFLSDNKFH